MSTCPVCERDVPGSADVLEHHVNAHFDGGDNGSGGQSSTTAVAGAAPASPTDLCFVCGADLGGFDGPAANAHVNACLDGGADGGTSPENGHYPDMYADDESDDDFYDPQGRLGGAEQLGRQGRKVTDAQWDGTVFADKRNGGDGAVAKGDKWWDPVRGSLAPGAVPLNICPGVIPVLREMLERSASGGSTRSAVLASAGAVHIKGSFGFDSTWGCGYRNALMAIAMLGAEYPTVFANRGDPGVRAIQTWIEEAWRAGFDATGRDQLKGKVVGTQKWIGTADLYTMFTSMGVPCTLFDFKKPSERQTDEPTHVILERWVRSYFDEDALLLESDDALEELMRPKVRIGTKYPFILQHAGHSRTVVGYELNGKDMNLLVFDPGKSVPKDVREAGIAALRSAREGNAQGSSTASRGTHLRSAIREGDAAAQPSSDEEMRSDGWVRKKKKKKQEQSGGSSSRSSIFSKSKGQDPLLSSLGVFRTNLGRWKHNEFQALVFPGTPLLAPETRHEGRVVSSIDVQR